TCSSAMARCGSSARSSTRTRGSPCPPATPGRPSMASTEVDSRSRARVAWGLLGGLAALAVLVVAVRYFTRPPQMGADDDVFKTVDALFTAVSMKDEAKLAQCEQRLHSHRDAGK